MNTLTASSNKLVTTKQIFARKQKEESQEIKTPNDDIDICGDAKKHYICCSK